MTLEQDTARRAAELVDQWIAGGGMIYDLPSLIAPALAEARRAERERCAARVREAYDGVCECDRVGGGPHRLSCEAGIGDDIAEALRQPDGAPGGA